MNDTKKEKSEHEERVRRALAAMPAEDDIAELAARFKAICEPSRLKILFALECGDMCVEHLTQAVGGNQSAVSHQLKTLKDHRIIKCKRQGKQVIYSIADAHILTMLDVAKEHLNCND
ncbi:MAG: metalloregulator ArsR/SmtB family transcription factor [Clostridia bacterium]|nr:metalloregulator ArsR/SmtB family transcription factor [Clostridia bacterium]